MYKHYICKFWKLVIFSELVCSYSYLYIVIINISISLYLLPLLLLSPNYAYYRVELSEKKICNKSYLSHARKINFSRIMLDGFRQVCPAWYWIPLSIYDLNSIQ